MKVVLAHTACLLALVSAGALAQGLPLSPPIQAPPSPWEDAPGMAITWANRAKYHEAVTREAANAREKAREHFKKHPNDLVVIVEMNATFDDHPAADVEQSPIKNISSVVTGSGRSTRTALWNAAKTPGMRGADSERVATLVYRNDPNLGFNGGVVPQSEVFAALMSASIDEDALSEQREIAHLNEADKAAAAEAKARQDARLAATEEERKKRLEEAEREKERQGQERDKARQEAQRRENTESIASDLKIWSTSDAKPQIKVRDGAPDLSNLVLCPRPEVLEAKGGSCAPCPVCAAAQMAEWRQAQLTELDRLSPQQRTELFKVSSDLERAISVPPTPAD